MRICWFDDYRLGLVQGQDLRDVSAALSVLPPARYPDPAKGDPLIANLAAVRKEIERIAPSAPLRRLADVKLLSPVARPSKIVGTPVNYVKHADEVMAEPETFTARWRGTIEQQACF